MKWLFVSLITLSAAFFLWPAEPESQLHAVRGQFSDQCQSLQRSIGLSFKSEQDIEELLYYKKAEQQAYEGTSKGRSNYSQNAIRSRNM